MHKTSLKYFKASKKKKKWLQWICQKKKKKVVYEVRKLTFFVNIFSG